MLIHKILNSQNLEWVPFSEFTQNTMKTLGEQGRILL
jgi:hypothetical protein